MTWQFSMRVYYEDTDFGGIVYYANYLKFIERARSEWIRNLGIDQRDLKTNRNTVFAVRHLEAHYLTPAKFDDVLEIATVLEKKTVARLILKQDVFRDKELLFSAHVTLVALTQNRKPTRLPAEIRFLVLQPTVR